MFYILFLKKSVEKEVVQPQLSTLEFTEERIIPTPQVVLHHRVRRKKHYILIDWQGFSPANATWEERGFIRNQFPDLSLEEKVVIKGERVVTCPLFCSSLLILIVSFIL